MFLDTTLTRHFKTLRNSLRELLYPLAPQTPDGEQKLLFKQMHSLNQRLTNYLYKEPHTNLAVQAYNLCHSCSAPPLSNVGSHR